MKKKLIILIFFLCFLLLYVCNIDNIPETIMLLKNEEINVKKLYGVTIEEQDYISTYNSKNGSETKLMNVKLGVISLKTISVTTLPDIEVVPLGNLVGLKIYTSGVLVVGIEDEEMYKKQDLKEGDTIIKVNDTDIESISDLRECVQNSSGDSLEIQYVSSDTNKIKTSTISPVKTENGEYRLGLWVKEGASGVGTISFYIPSENTFAALRTWNI